MLNSYITSYAKIKSQVDYIPKYKNIKCLKLLEENIEDFYNFGVGKYILNKMSTMQPKKKRLANLTSIKLKLLYAISK